MRNARPVLPMLLLAAALLCPLGSTVAAAAIADDHVELVSLTTRSSSGGSTSNVVPFRAVVNYRMQSTSNGFLLLFVFENSAISSTRQSSARVPVQGGEGQVTLDLDYTLQSDLRTLSLMVALFKTEQKLLAWVATTPVDLAPWPGRAAFNQAMAARLTEDYASAERYLSSAIAASPEVGNYYYWRGDTRIYLSHYDDAAEDFSRSISLMPNDRASRLGRGVALLWKAEPQAAVDDLSFAIDQTPSPPDRVTAFAFRARGTAYAALRQPVEAISDYQAYLALIPAAPDRAEIEGWIAELT